MPKGLVYNLVFPLFKYEDAEILKCNITKHQHVDEAISVPENSQKPYKFLSRFSILTKWINFKILNLSY